MKRKNWLQLHRWMSFKRMQNKVDYTEAVDDGMSAI